MRGCYAKFFARLISIIDGNIRKLSDDVPQKRVLAETIQYATNLLINFKRSVQVEEEVLNMINESAPIQMFLNSLATMHGVKIESNLESSTLALTLTIKPAEIMRLMDNLIENAKRAGATEVKISDKVYGNVLCTEITDNGKGMTAEELARVGFNFSTQDGDHGKGSTLLRTLVESNGGVLDWRSEGPGKGTTVRMRLPVEHIGKSMGCIRSTLSA